MTGAAIPPAVVADAATAARAWLRAADGDDTAAIAALTTSAILLAEAFCGRALIARDWHEAIAADGTWHALTARPVAAIAGVTDVGGVALAAGTYAIDIDADGTGWVRVSAPPASTSAATLVAVDYAAGEAAGWDAVPPPIAQGVAMLVAHLFDDRDAGGAPPAAVAALWRPWRRLQLGMERRP